MADSSNTIDPTSTANSTFPVEYWPVRHPAGNVDHPGDMRACAAALLLATSGRESDIQDGPHHGNLYEGVSWLATALFHMTVQFHEHGYAAGKGGAA